MFCGRDDSSLLSFLLISFSSNSFPSFPSLSLSLPFTCLRFSLLLALIRFSSPSLSLFLSYEFCFANESLHSCNISRLDRRPQQRIARSGTASWIRVRIQQQSDYPAVAVLFGKQQRSVTLFVFGIRERTSLKKEISILGNFFAYIFLFFSFLRGKFFFFLPARASGQLLRIHCVRLDGLPFAAAYPYDPNSDFRRERDKKINKLLKRESCCCSSLLCLLLFSCFFAVCFVCFLLIVEHCANESDMSSFARELERR